MPPGGLLNYVTKRPRADMPNEVEVQLGSDDMKQAAFDIGGALNESGTVLYRLTGLARNSDNFVDYIHDDRYYFAPALTWKPDAATELTSSEERHVGQEGVSTLRSRWSPYPKKKKNKQK